MVSCWQQTLCQTTGRSNPSGLHTRMHSCSHAVKALAQLHQSQLMMQISVFHHKCLQHSVGHVSAASLTQHDIKSNYNNDLSTNRCSRFRLHAGSCRPSHNITCSTSCSETSICMVRHKARISETSSISMFACWQANGIFMISHAGIWAKHCSWMKTTCKYPSWLAA